MPAPVYLVRHGQSEWNVLRLTQGQTPHPPLTSIGREQARDAASAIAADLAANGHRAARVLSSDLTRAIETAGVIAEQLDLEVVSDARLREQDLGELEGKSYDDAWAAAELHDWSDPDLPIAGGESLTQVRERMVAALSDLEPGAAHVLVSHGDSIRAAIAHVRGEAANEASWVEVPNGSVARIDAEVTWPMPV